MVVPQSGSLYLYGCFTACTTSVTCGDSFSSRRSLCCNLPRPVLHYTEEEGNPMYPAACRQPEKHSIPYTCWRIRFINIFYFQPYANS